MGSISLILIGLFTVMVIAVILMIIIVIRFTGNKNTGAGMSELRSEMHCEIDRSRRETIETVQSSIRTLGNMISQNQRESADMQSMRLTELNRQLSETLEQVTAGMGEMRNLASGVGELQKILSNVKTRGILGEVQLGAILQQILAPEQYEENVAVSGGSERVEYAVKFPGEGDSPVYLPIDAKFPADAYVRLMNAYDSGNRLEIKAASDGLKNAVVKAAKDISSKYIHPPETTEFAVMFLPFEGLYAEVLRLGMMETLQRDFRVSIAGPANMAAMLNSFQMGFRSFALQKKSGEVWNTLARAKSEFDKFAEVLDRSILRMEQTQKELEALVGVRTRGIQRALKNVSEMTDDEMEKKE
ncbi:MAG: DNA recombination protein RmuC [Bacillota bacterium]|nr:DNA recombination protein RmuC [Bacillota bacterium]